MQRDRLSGTLRAAYESYKAGTSVVIQWLVNNASKKVQKKTHTVNEFPVKRILELARKAVELRRKPPPDLDRAFKSVLVNRRTLTRHYEAKGEVPGDVQQSTDRHVYFNQTLAQAYDVLFYQGSGSVAENERARKTVSSTRVIPEVRADRNRFDALNDLIEQEPDFDPIMVMPSEMDDVARPTITDDPMQGFLAMFAYVSQVEIIIQTTVEAWERAAQGDLPITVASLLTKFAFEEVKILVKGHGSSFNHHDGLARNY
jgi:hypothetical protein